MKILLIGPQGSGKSTQAELLSRYLNVPVVSTGEIFRKLAQENTDIGQALKNILNEGRLVDDQLTCKIVKETLSKSDYQGGFVVDGYPRTIEQLKIFDPKFDMVFYLNVPEKEVIKRLMARGREDDTKQLIKTRLNLYHEQTKPLLVTYKNQGILVEIDGNSGIEKIQDEIRKQIQTFE